MYTKPTRAMFCRKMKIVRTQCTTCFWLYNIHCNFLDKRQYMQITPCVCNYLIAQCRKCVILSRDVIIYGSIFWDVYFYVYIFTYTYYAISIKPAIMTANKIWQHFHSQVNELLSTSFYNQHWKPERSLVFALKS
jgi:hypothetical protein